MSTLDVHGWGSSTVPQDVAIDNVRRFVALDGTVVYGTDLGNGPLPLGVNPRELWALGAAGLGPDAILAALTADRPTAGASTADAPRPGAQTSLATWIPGDPPDRPDDPDELAAWLARAVVVEHPPGTGERVPDHDAPGYGAPDQRTDGHRATDLREDMP